MANYPRLSIVFPNLNGAKVLSAFLNSVKGSSYDKRKLEIIMVDNGSSDGSIEFVRQNFPKVKIIQSGRNFGFAKAVNLGIQKSLGVYIFVTNNDVLLDKNCLKNLAEFAKKNKIIGVTGPIVFENSKQIPVKSLKFNFYTGLFKKLNTLEESDWISGAGMFFQKKLWQKLGGFDEGFFFTFEDLDFCLRAKRAGFRIIHTPKAKIFHQEGATVNRPEFTYFKYFESYKSKLRLVLKHANLFQILTSFVLQFFVFAPYRFFVLKEKSFIPLIKALSWNLQHLSQTLSVRRKIYAV